MFILRANLRSFVFMSLKLYFQEKLNGVKRKRGNSSMYKDDLEEQHTFLRTNGLDQFSQEEDLSD